MNERPIMYEHSGAGSGQEPPERTSGRSSKSALVAHQIQILIGLLVQRLTSRCHQAWGCEGRIDRTEAATKPCGNSAQNKSESAEERST